jgi:hypothetical protein
MYRFTDVPVRSVAGGVGSRDLAAVVLANGAVARPGEARAR